jgi:hypothetical protein
LAQTSGEPGANSGHTWRKPTVNLTQTPATPGTKLLGPLRKPALNLTQTPSTLDTITQTWHKWAVYSAFFAIFVDC